jgi:hypothetical protein
MGGTLYGRPSDEPSYRESGNSLRSIRGKEPGDIGIDLQSDERAYSARIKPASGLAIELDSLPSTNT